MAEPQSIENKVDVLWFVAAHSSISGLRGSQTFRPIVLLLPNSYRCILGIVLMSSQPAFVRYIAPEVPHDSEVVQVAREEGVVRILLRSPEGNPDFASVYGRGANEGKNTGGYADLLSVRD